MNKVRFADNRVHESADKFSYAVVQTKSWETVSNVRVTRTGSQS
jgi:hypothetical protein